MRPLVCKSCPIMTTLNSRIIVTILGEEIYCRWNWYVVCEMYLLFVFSASMVMVSCFVLDLMYFAMMIGLHWCRYQTPFPKLLDRWVSRERGTSHGCLQLDNSLYLQVFIYCLNMRDRHRMTNIYVWIEWFHIIETQTSNCFHIYCLN